MLSPHLVLDPPSVGPHTNSYLEDVVCGGHLIANTQSSDRVYFLLTRQFIEFEMILSRCLGLGSCSQSHDLPHGSSSMAPGMALTSHNAINLCHRLPFAPWAIESRFSGTPSPCAVSTVLLLLLALCVSDRAHRRTVQPLMM